MSTWPYFIVLLAGFCLQYGCDARCIAETARRSHWSVSRIRWSPLARFFHASERCYKVSIRDLHGRVDTRTCRVRGVIGLPVEVAFERAAPAPRRR